MSGAPVRAVVFDAVGTLIHPDPPWYVVYAEVGRRHGSHIDEPKLQKAFRDAFARQEHSDRAAGWRTGEAREVRRWQTIVREVLHDANNPDACFAALYEHFSQPGHWRCDVAAASLFDALAARGCRIAMASNFDHRLRRIAASLPPLGQLADVVISAEVGWRKPAGEFYGAVCTRLELKPPDVMYVGDDLVNDYEGATAAGMRALLLDSTGRAPQNFTSIRQLSEVLAF